MLRTILLSLALSGSALSYATAGENHDWSGPYIGGVISYHSGENFGRLHQPAAPLLR